MIADIKAPREREAAWRQLLEQALDYPVALGEAYRREVVLQRGYDLTPVRLLRVDVDEAGNAAITTYDVVGPNLEEDTELRVRFRSEGALPLQWLQRMPGMEHRVRLNLDPAQFSEAYSAMIAAEEWLTYTVAEHMGGAVPVAESVEPD